MDTNRYVKISYFGYNGFEADDNQPLERKERIAKLPERYGEQFVSKNKVVFAQTSPNDSLRTAIITGLDVSGTEIRDAITNHELQQIYVVPRESDTFVKLLQRMAIQNGHGRQITF